MRAVNSVIMMNRRGDIMEPIRIEHRKTYEYGLTMLAVLWLAALIFFFVDIPKGYLGGMFFTCSGLLVAAMCFLEGSKVEVFSIDGILLHGVKKTRSILWNQIKQIGISVACQGRANEHLALSFTFAGGIPRKPKQMLRNWMLQNETKNILTVPYSQELHQLILQCYGALDYDEMSGPQQF